MVRVIKPQPTTNNFKDTHVSPHKGKRAHTMHFCEAYKCKRVETVQTRFTPQTNHKSLPFPAGLDVHGVFALRLFRQC